MNLTNLDHDAVLYVARNMRESDKEEIYGLREKACPFQLMNDAMAAKSFSWVAWLDGRPVAVFGGMPRQPGTWSMYCFATDEFPRLALGLTRFAKKAVLPTLFGQLGAHRLECDSHESHVSAHRWLRLLGAELEAVKRQYGKDGADYFSFVLLSAIDKSDKSS